MRVEMPKRASTSSPATWLVMPLLLMVIASACESESETGGLAVEDCLETCLELGRCIVVGGRCKVGSDKHCTQSAICKNSGRCTPHEGGDGYCVADSVEDCQQSTECETHGSCGLAQLRPSGQYCSPTNDQHCEESDACKQDGRCTWARGRGCVVGGDSDCMNSETCKQDGQCFWSPGLEKCTQGIANQCDGASLPRSSLVSFVCAADEECTNGGKCNVMWPGGECRPSDDDACLPGRTLRATHTCHRPCDNGSCPPGYECIHDLTSAGDLEPMCFQARCETDDECGPAYQCLGSCARRRCKDACCPAPLRCSGDPDYLCVEPK